MKKIKLLRNLAILYGLANVAYATYTISTVKLFQNTSVHSYFYSFIIKSVAEYLLSLPALVLIIIALNAFVKQGAFSPRSTRLLQYTGFLLILQAAVDPIAHYFLPFGNGAFFIVASVYASVLPLCFGIGLLVIADFIKRAHSLKEENQLTI